MSNTVITIDGGAGVGKSSVAKKVAAALASANVLHTGIAYRLLGLASHTHFLSSAQNLQSLLRIVTDEFIVDLDAHPPISVRGDYDLDRLDEPLVSMRAAEVAQSVEVRRVMNMQFRAAVRCCSKSTVIAEGRDMATVFDKAALKILLLADSAVAAKRLVARSGMTAEAAARDIRIRNGLDQQHLQSGNVNVIIDTTHLSEDAVATDILGRLRALRPLQTVGIGQT